MVLGTIGVFPYGCADEQYPRDTMHVMESNRRHSHCLENQIYAAMLLVRHRATSGSEVSLVMTVYKCSTCGREAVVAENCCGQTMVTVN